MLRARNLIFGAALRRLGANGVSGSLFLSSAAQPLVEKDEAPAAPAPEVDEAGVRGILEALKVEAPVISDLMKPWKDRVGSKTVNRVLEEVSSEKTCLSFLEWACKEEFPEKNRMEAYTVVLQRLAGAGMGKELRELLRKMRETGLFIKKVVFSEVVSLLVRSGQLEEITGIFQDLVEDHLVSFQVEVVKTLYEKGRLDVAFSLVESMAPREVLLQLAAGIIGKNDAEGLKALVKALRSEPEFCLVLELLCKEMRLEQACELLDKMPEAGVTPGPASYTRLADGFIRASKFPEAYAVLDVMAERGCVPEPWIFNRFLEGLCKAGELEKAFKMFKTMVEYDRFPDAGSYNTLINGLCLQGEATRARALLEEMIAGGFLPDASTYSSLILGHRKAGELRTSIRLLEEMLSKGWMPEKGIFQGILNSLCREKDAEGVRRFIQEHGSRFELDTHGYGMVMSIYGKFGKLEEARELFQEMRARRIPPTIIVLNAIMFLLCQKKQVDEAMELYRKMPRNLVPDLYSYTILIGGLCDAGRIDEACLMRERMIQSKCKPDKVTYGILVAGLMRAGRRSEAEEMNKKMIAAEIPGAQQIPVIGE